MGNTKAEETTSFLSSLDYSEPHGITIKPGMSGSKHDYDGVKGRQIGIIFYSTKRNGIQHSRFHVLWKYVLSMLLLRRSTDTVFQTRKRRRYDFGFVSCGREGPSTAVKISGSFQTNKCGVSFVISLRVGGAEDLLCFLLINTQNDLLLQHERATIHFIHFFGEFCSCLNPERCVVVIFVYCFGVCFFYSK